jgi:hypothetical protein
MFFASEELHKTGRNQEGFLAVIPLSPVAMRIKGDNFHGRLSVTVKYYTNALWLYLCSSQILFIS